jgi:hypothetical protein
MYILVVHILKHCGDGHPDNSCASAFCCQCDCVVQELKTSGFKGTSFRINIACWLIACSRAIKAIARHYVYTPPAVQYLEYQTQSFKKQCLILRLCSSLAPDLHGYTARPVTVNPVILSQQVFAISLRGPDWIRRCMLGKSKPGSRGKQSHFQPYKFLQGLET